MNSNSHGHVDPPPPTDPHYLCRPASSFQSNPKVTMIEVCTGKKPPVMDVYFFANPIRNGACQKMHSFAHFKRTSTYPKKGLKFCTGLLPYGNPPTCYTAYTDGACLQGGGFGTVENPILGLPPMYNSAWDGDFCPPPDGLNLYQERALASMLPGIKPSLSLVNSLLELKDFKSLPRTLSNLTSLIPKGTKTLRKIFRASADAYLQGNFNILPLLRDITGIQQVITSTEKELRNLIQRQHRVQKMHFKASMHPSFVDSDSGYVPGVKTYPSGHPSIFGNAKVRRVVTYRSREFHAEIWYSYWLGSAELEQARCRAYLDKLGVNLNPAILWNAIPWSFVVDWVVGIGPWLNQFTSRNIEPVCIIHRYLYSYKVGRTILLYGKLEATDGHHGGGDTLSAQHEDDSYKRVVGMPNIYQAIKTSGLNPKEFSLGAALAYLRLSS